jgi:hypothetical protein
MHSSRDVGQDALLQGVTSTSWRGRRRSRRMRVFYRIGCPFPRSGTGNLARFRIPGASILTTSSGRVTAQPYTTRFSDSPRWFPRRILAKGRVGDTSRTRKMHADGLDERFGSFAMCSIQVLAHSSWHNRRACPQFAVRILVDGANFSPIDSASTVVAIPVIHNEGPQPVQPSLRRGQEPAWRPELLVRAAARQPHR